MSLHTNLNEASLEDIIVEHLTQVNKYEQGVSSDYDMHYAMDLGRLEAYLLDTQKDLVQTSRIFATPTNKRKFLERVRDEITKRGVVDVLNKGVKHLSNTFYFYCPSPSELNPAAKVTYKKNRFCVIRQLHYSKENERLALDVCILINGLPIITMELKNQITCQDTAHAVQQYCNDRDAKDLLFMPKRCAVHFAADDETVMMCTKLCGKDSWFLPFNKGYEDGAGNPPNPNGLKTAYLWEDILTKESLSNILEHYAQVIVEEDEDTGKKQEKIIWPRYHQLELVRMLLRLTKENEVGQRYLIQHSAGSGKSNSITWLAYQLVELLRNKQLLFDSIIIVTDRVNLDKQLRDNVKAFTSNENIVDWAQSSAKLKEHLENGKKIILTTVQKFSFILEAVGSDLADKRFAVIIDEAHSSQGGSMSASQNQVLAGGIEVDDPTDEGDEIEKKVNRTVKAFMEKRRMASNANFYAFTATPKNKTLETFGTAFQKEDGETGHMPIHVYSMKQAIEEKFILDVLKGYTTYQSYYRIVKSIEGDPEFDRIQANKKLRYFVESRPENVLEKARIIVEHFHTKTASKIGGEARAMVICAGIERAIDYYYEIEKLLKERNSPYRCIVAFTGEQDYGGKKVTESSINGFPSSQIEKTFKKDPYRFLIVADKFQTGYDEPLLHTMYVDKPLQGVKTVQTLSRLNRTRPKKTDTCVIDFVNTTDEIEKAFQDFYKCTILERETDPNKLNDLIDVIEKYDIYMQREVEELNTHFWSKDSRKTIDPILDTCKERFKALKIEAQVECKSAIKTFIRTYDFLSKIIECTVEWEMKQTFYSLLIHKLPKLAMEDTTEGLLDSVDFDKYRIVKREERDIKLKNESAFVAPVPTAINTGVAEEDITKLSDIVDDFNLHFGNIEWKDPDVVRRQFQEVIDRVMQDDSVRDAVLNADEDTANQSSDTATATNLSIITENSTQLTTEYWKRPDFQEFLNQRVREAVRNRVNPDYDENDLKRKMTAEFEENFMELCDGVHYVAFKEMLDIFFEIVNAETIPELQGLRNILRHRLNCLYRAEYREEDLRTWYQELTTRFEAFMKKVYWLREGQPVPLTAEGREPAFIDTVKHFPKLQNLYYTTNEKYLLFKDFYNTVYKWRNNECHVAIDVPMNLMPVSIHAAVALYLYLSLVSAADLQGKF